MKKKQRSGYPLPFVLAASFLPLLMVALTVFAQESKMAGMEGMQGMCPLCGGGGIALAVLGGLLLIAAIVALIALAVFLVRRSRS